MWGHLAANIIVLEENSVTEVVYTCQHWAVGGLLHVRIVLPCTWLLMCSLGLSYLLEATINATVHIYLSRVSPTSGESKVRLNSYDGS